MPTLSETTRNVPVHVGIIMDGNGRWAQKRNLPRTAGHKAGVDRAREIMLAAIEAGIKYLTLYTFSTENWKRPESEVSYLMRLLGLHLKTEVDFYRKNGIRLHHLGDITKLSPELQKDIKHVIEDSKENTRLNLVLAINYGGKDEINRAVGKYITDIIADNKIKVPETIDISKYLDLPFLPDADLIIRTGGEKRISNFLLWQSAYTEFDFCDILWPDYTKNDFFESINRFMNIDRRFGGVKQ
ncbi:MAG: di-trans,poly-cis-decaprenylcistransferase [Treponemataceae bacterium]|nr:di-trans,poly-cis-decaprenylcistransferase [Treponemataceae bacterium]